MKYTFNVPDMSCNHCKMRIEKTMNESGKVNSLNIDLGSKKSALNLNFLKVTLFHYLTRRDMTRL